jgi:RHS repeat-associated protein
MTSDSGLQTSSFTPQFDDDGNQTLIQTSTGVWSVQYNGENRPVLWTGGTQSAATNIVMSFDRMGRRMEYREIQTTGASGGNTPTTINTHHRFVYDNYLCIQRLDAANGNAVDFAFVWDVTEPIATRPLIVDKPVVSMAYMSHDGNKNVVELIFTLDSLEIRTHYEYCPFGSQKKASSILSTSTMNACECNPFRFSSEYHDDSLGLVCYNFRHYNTLTGRWLTRDPLRMYEASGIYIGTMNSVMGTDLLGLMVLPISIIPPEPPIDEARRQRCNEIRERFEKWYAQEKARLSKRDQSGKNWVEQLPHCPSELLKVGRKYVSPDESEWKLTWYFGITQKLSNYHPGGIYELRTKYPNKYGGSHCYPIAKDF